MESKETAPVKALNPSAGDTSDMTTNFFQHLLSLGENALWHITIQIDNGYFIISTMLSETRGEPRPTILKKLWRLPERSEGSLHNFFRLHLALILIKASHCSINK